MFEANLFANSIRRISDLPASLSLPGRDCGLFLAFEGIIADTSGYASASSRVALMRLFQALGGAVAVFSQRDVAELDRLLGLPELPLIGSDGVNVRSLQAHAVAGHRPLDRLLDLRPFAGRTFILYGADAAPKSLRTAMKARGATMAGGSGAQLALRQWMDQLAPIPSHPRIHA